MKLKKSFLAAIAAAGVGATALGATAVFAASSGEGMKGGMNDLVAVIATRFNLDQDDVQAVFDEQRGAHEAKRQQAEADRLTQAIADGKLTQAQADAITAKRAEMEADRPDSEEMQSMTEEEHKADMEAKKAEMDAWIEENDIPQEYMFFGHHGRGPGGPGGRGQAPQGAPGRQ